ncbi:MAG: zinc ribbon domain-containing protein [Ruminococcaceae bacterium]|nr:zinc ribbon domain-containing protein [Oscillospiraceae bacterium]
MNDDIMFCYQCGNKLIDEALFCPYCGTAVRSAQPEPTPAPAPEPEPKPEPPQPSPLPPAPQPIVIKVRKCCICGNKLDDNSGICTNCGCDTAKTVFFESEKNVMTIVSTAPSSEAVVAPALSLPKIRLCKVCESVLDDDSIFCAHCGSNLTVTGFTEKTIENATEAEEQVLADVTSRIIATNDPPSQDAAKNNPLSAGFNKNLLKEKRFQIPMVVILIILFGVYYYCVSDAGRIHRASLYVLGGAPEEVYSILQDVSSMQAKTLIAFANVEIAYQKYENAYENSSDLQDATTAYTALHKIFNTFKEEQDTFYLPDNIYNRYCIYEATFEYIDQLNIPLKNMMLIYLNYYEDETAKEGNTFTIQTWQNRLETCEEALEEFNTLLSFSSPQTINIRQNAYYPVQIVSLNPGSDFPELDNLRLGVKLSRELDEFKDGVASEIEHTKGRIDTLLEEWDVDARLYNKNPETDFSVSLFSDILQDIDGISSINKNVTVLRNMINEDILYFALNEKIGR